MEKCCLFKDSELILEELTLGEQVPAAAGAKHVPLAGAFDFGEVLTLGEFTFSEVSTLERSLCEVSALELGIEFGRRAGPYRRARQTRTSRRRC